MTTILNLPEDVIINLCNYLTTEDVRNLSLTCNQFDNMIRNNNAIWRSKFYRRWPNFKKVYKMLPGLNYHKLMELNTKYVEQLQQYLTQMNEECYKIKFAIDKEWINNENFDFDIYINKNQLLSYIEKLNVLKVPTIIDELYTMLQSKKNLTNTYYAKKLLPYIKHYYLANMWKEFIKRPIEKQLSEEVMNIFSLWCDPENNIPYRQYKIILNNLSQEILKKLKIINPNHPIFSASHEEFRFWKFNNIDNQWNENDGKQILDIVCEFITENDIYRFIKQENIKLFSDHNKYTILYIIIQNVARRLGIRCDIMECNLTNIPTTNCFMIWKPKSESHVQRSTIYDTRCFFFGFQQYKCILFEWFYYNTKMRIVSKTNLFKSLAIQNRELLEFPEYCIMDRWLRQLIRMINHTSFTYIFSDTIHFTTIRKEQISFVNLLLHTNKESIQTKKRQPEQLFAVGMIVKFYNKRILYRGVINEWYKHNGENSKIIYYDIILQDYIYRNISQDRLIKENEPKPIESSEIGRYFCEFKDNYYMPNKMMAQEYQEDVIFLINNL